MKDRLRKVMTAVLIIQVILFGIAIFGGNTIKSLSEEHLSILEDRVSLRRNYVEEEMLQYSSDLMEFEGYMQSAVKEVGILEDLQLIPELLEKVVNRTIFTLRQSNVTEIFIIIEGENGHEGIHLRDLDPSFNAIDNSDILMERGSMDIARKINVALDSQWAQKFNLLEEDENAAFYYKPFKSAKLYHELSIKDLAYWSKPFRHSPDDIEIITCSIPLLDEQGNSYGVIGVGITVDYLSGKLKYDELVKNKRGAYLISVNDTNIDSTKKIVSSGPMYTMLVGNQKEKHKKVGYKNINIVKGNENIDGQVYASIQDLNLYNKGTPFFLIDGALQVL